MGYDARLSKVETAFGVNASDGPCEKCGQAGAPFGGLTREEALRAAEQRALERPHTSEASATAFPCPKCGRPRIVVMQSVDYLAMRGGPEGGEACE